ncbi:60S ribosomal protein L5 [Camellia lanceoleosa]|uniref:60S ribosomal protein L5 n=1 Tax=Camellia lanceoleosa TaxID=1840588 RepID=A0ACC0GRW5_9ERIC|nr:60S ribosomal protein L5 [Camellia lanceoleosa]
MVLASVYAHELPRYGLEVGLTNYVVAYFTGLPLARRVLKMLEMDNEYEGNVEVSYGFKCQDFLAIYKSLSLTNAVGLKGSIGWQVGYPHGDKRFSVCSGSEVHRKYIYGGHVAAYMKRSISLILLSISREELSLMALRSCTRKFMLPSVQTPTQKKSEKESPKQHKRYNLKKLTYDEGRLA